jgi:hypothetical protein
MSSRRVKTSEDVINELFDREFEGLSQDIKDIFEQIEQEEFEKRKIDNEKYKNYSLDKYSKNSDKYNIKTNINTNNNNYNTNAGRLNNLMNTDMIMKDIRELCKANQIKLSRIVNDKRVIYTKKELITKLKRKKII